MNTAMIIALAILIGAGTASIWIMVQDFRKFVRDQKRRERLHKELEKLNRK